MTVDMSSIGVAGQNLVDGLHPTDTGYNDMANLWFQALQQASAKGWITAPDTPLTGSGSHTSQKCGSGLFWYPANNGKQIASGVGSGGDALFHNNWSPQGQVASGLGLNGTGVTFADLDGDGKDEYIWVNATNGAVIAYYNKYGVATNTAAWVPINNGKPIASGVGNGSQVTFADVDGDGLADYLFIHDGGAVDAYINKGADASSQGWSWAASKQIASGVSGASASNVLFADINNDGRADYLLLYPDGALDLYLNIAPYGSSDITWVPYTKIASGLGNPNITLKDLDGDGMSMSLLPFRIHS